MTQVAIQLDDTLAEALNAAALEEHLPPERIVLDALKRRLAGEWLKRSQQSLRGAAEAAGFMTEDDILNDIS